MALTGNLPKVQTTSATMAVIWWFEQRWSAVWVPLRLWATGDRATTTFASSLAPVNPVDTAGTAGAAETSPNFARNSPERVLGHPLKTAEYQRFDFKV